MSVVDIAVLLVLAIAVLGGWYRGFLDALFGLAATIVSFLLGLLGIPLVANAIRSHEQLYNMLLYYTEGAEYVAATDVELIRMPVSDITRDQLQTIIQNADMPLPMGASHGTLLRRRLQARALRRSVIISISRLFPSLSTSSRALRYL